MTEEKKPKPLRGTKQVSNYQRMIIRTVIEKGSRANAASYLQINPDTLDDAIYRACRALNVSNITDANYLISQGIFSRKENPHQEGSETPESE